MKTNDKQWQELDKLVFGLPSALSQANRIGLNNMPLSAPLVKELCEKVIAQADEIERLKSDFREVVNITLNPTAVDFVRCGIGANYSGNYYCKMVDKIHSPIVNLMMKHANTNSNGESKNEK